MAFFHKRKGNLFTCLLSTAILLAGCGGGGDDKSDTSPDSFEFDDLTNVALATYIESSGIEVDGINEEVEISISNGYYSIDGSEYTDEDGVVVDGQIVNVKVLSSDKLSTTTSATLVIGDKSDTFDVETVDIDLSIRSRFKGLTFDWPYVSGATTYKIKEKATDAADYKQIGRTIDASSTALSMEFPIHLHDWWNALYMLTTCTNDDCSDTGPLSATSYARNAIGYIKSENPDAHDNYSIIAVSADGETIAVGAPGEDSSSRIINGDGGNNSRDGSGAVYVYRKIESDWQFEALIKAPNADEGDQFGSAVTLSADGNIMAIGAPSEDSASVTIDGDMADNTAENAGAVYVYTRSGSTWLLQSYIKATNAGAEDFFGSSLALSATGATLVVGAPEEDSAYAAEYDATNNDAANSGAAYVFNQSLDTWAQTALIKSNTAAAGEQFGYDLSLSANGNTLAISMPGVTVTNNISTYPAAGAVQLFARENTAWTLTTSVTPSTPSEDLKFGYSVDLSDDGNWLAVGAPGDNSTGVGVDADASTAGNTASGAAYLYAFSSNSWNLVHFIKSSNGDAQDKFGSAVALNSNGTVLVVSAPGEASQAEAINGDEYDNTEASSGAAYSYSHAGNDYNWSFVSYIKAPTPHNSDQFGTQIQLDASGNLLVISAPGEKSKNAGISASQYDTSLPNAGAIYLY